MFGELIGFFFVNLWQQMGQPHELHPARARPGPRHADGRCPARRRQGRWLSRRPAPAALRAERGSKRRTGRRLAKYNPLLVGAARRRQRRSALRRRQRILRRAAHQASSSRPTTAGTSASSASRTVCAASACRRPDRRLRRPAGGAGAYAGEILEIGTAAASDAAARAQGRGAGRQPSTRDPLIYRIIADRLTAPEKKALTCIPRTPVRIAGEPTPRSERDGQAG